MHAPHISQSVWWVIAVIAVVLFVAVWLPMMPTSRSRNQISLIPVVGIVFLTVLGKLRGHSLTELLSMYSTGLLALTLGVLGRREDMRVAVKQGEDPLGTSASKAAEATKRLTVQLLTAITAAFVLWAWLTWG